jgi:hypothetical protein
MSIICRKADFLEEYNLENKKDKKKLRKDPDIFLKNLFYLKWVHQINLTFKVTVTL